MKTKVVDEDESDRLLQLVAEKIVTIPVISAMLLQAGVVRNRGTILLDVKKGVLKTATITDRFHVTTLAEAKRYVARCAAVRQKQLDRQKFDSRTTERYVERFASDEAA